MAIVSFAGFCSPFWTGVHTMGVRGKYIFHRFTIDRPGSAKARASSWPRDIGVCSLAAANVRRVDALRTFGFQGIQDRLEMQGPAYFA